MPQIQPVLDKYGFKDFEEVEGALNNARGVDAYKIVESISAHLLRERQAGLMSSARRSQSKKGVQDRGRRGALPSAKACRHSAFPVPSRISVKVGIGHGNLGAMLLDEETECFCVPRGSRVLRGRGGRDQVSL